MADDVLAAVENALERVRTLPAEEAETLLRSARDDLEAARSRASVDDEAVDALETRLDQRIREVAERDAYDGGMGAAMDPDEEDAP